VRRGTHCIAARPNALALQAMHARLLRMTLAGSGIVTCASSAGKAWRESYFYVSVIAEGRTRP
jgi:hypothetical protein